MSVSGPWHEMFSARPKALEKAVGKLMFGTLLVTVAYKCDRTSHSSLARVTSRPKHTGSASGLAACRRSQRRRLWSPRTAAMASWWWWLIVVEDGDTALWNCLGLVSRTLLGTLGETAIAGQAGGRRVWRQTSGI